LEAAVITDEVYMEIELLRKHGMSLRKIAAEVGCAVNTVRSHLEADTRPRYQRNKLRVTKLSPFGDYLRERQAAAHPRGFRRRCCNARLPRKVMLGIEPVARLSAQPQACFSDGSGGAVRDGTGK
jgi:transposase